MKKICFVGITNKVHLEPFDFSTKSGQIIQEIISRLDVMAFKMNYVDYAPIGENGKLRYPTKSELREAFPVFQEKILNLAPDLLVVCGNMVAKELEIHQFYQDKILVIYHPSYVYVYQRNHTEQYILDVVKQIKEIIF